MRSILAAAVVGLAGVAGAAEVRRPPNIVMFLADDLGQRDLGTYGSTFYETPNLDRLAREGAKFTDAYAACPVCSPTRASLLTGQWPQRTGVTDYIGAAKTPDEWKRNTKSLPAPYADRLALDAPTIATVRGLKIGSSSSRRLEPGTASLLQSSTSTSEASIGPRLRSSTGSRRSGAIRLDGHHSHYRRVVVHPDVPQLLIAAVLRVREAE